MIIGSSIMGIAEKPFTKMFTVAIQFGAILSVVVLYWKRFFQSRTRAMIDSNSPTDRNFNLFEARPADSAQRSRPEKTAI